MLAVATRSRLKCFLELEERAHVPALYRLPYASELHVPTRLLNTAAFLHQCATELHRGEGASWHLAVRISGSLQGAGPVATYPTVSEHMAAHSFMCWIKFLYFSTYIDSPTMGSPVSAGMCAPRSAAGPAPCSTAGPCGLPSKDWPAVVHMRLGEITASCCRGFTLAKVGTNRTLYHLATS